MKFSRRHFLGALAVGSAGLVSQRVFATVRLDEPPVQFARAKAAFDTHRAVIGNGEVMGIVDFSQPSAQPRFDLVDIVGGRVLASHLVAHGRGSDPGNSGWVHLFSNQPGSNASCRGSFVTGELYSGKHGRSRKVRGLDAENCLAESRAIVIHGAPYVSPVAAVAHGRIGRSEGCFAVAPEQIGQVLSRLGERCLLFAWK
jgi:hypothetical protein